MEAQAKKREEELQKLRKGAGGPNAKPQGAGTKDPEAAKILKQCQERLADAQKAVNADPCKELYKLLLADAQAELERAQPQQQVATSELHDQLESLQREIEGEKARFDKKHREELKLQRQQEEICGGIQERQEKIQKLQEEVAKRSVALTVPVATPLPSTTAPVMQPPSAA